MKSEVLNELIAEEKEIQFKALPGWTKFISYMYFFNSALFAVLSVAPFILKRTTGFDSYLNSGYYPGTIQLFFFVISIILAVVSFIMGYYLYSFSGLLIKAEEHGFNHETSSALSSLKWYFSLFGTVSLIIYLAGLVALLIHLAE